ncbi:response regulator [Brucella anthropi]|uniref:response regulator n=1 Tax=Brucella anthropi TaxID=529 RepID=UPI002157217E|nr:response regulator [Brucella anthropi]MCR8493065.1 response regulator [Brucella anthropi]
MFDQSKKIDLRNTSALIVDDNIKSLELLNQVLLGFRMKQIVTAQSADQAEHHLNSDRFNILIIDTEMPQENGLALTRRLRRNRSNPNATAPVIMMAAHTSLERINEARNAGVNLVVKKPIVPGVLLQRIAWLARNHRDFVRADNYCGPDRRFRKTPPADGVERRAEIQGLLADNSRALSQNDIDSLFD